MICSFMETERKIYSIFERFSTCAKQELGGKILKPAAVENGYLIVRYVHDELKEEKAGDHDE